MGHPQRFFEDYLCVEMSRTRQKEFGKQNILRKEIVISKVWFYSIWQHALNEERQNREIGLGRALFFSLRKALAARQFVTMLRQRDALGRKLCSHSLSTRPSRHKEVVGGNCALPLSELLSLRIKRGWAAIVFSVVHSKNGCGKLAVTIASRFAQACGFPNLSKEQVDVKIRNITTVPVTIGLGREWMHNSDELEVARGGRGDQKRH